MADDITNKELVEALRPMYGQGPSIGLKLLWQEALKRLAAAPDVPADALSTDTRAQVSGGDTEWPKETTVSEQTVASGTVPDATSASASDTDGQVPTAKDTPVARMPTTSSERARLRMGHRDGKGRP